MFIPKGRKNLPTALIGMGRHLIYSEGIKTEPYYIESIKESIANVNLCDINDIEIVPVNKDSESYNTLGLVDYALNDIKRRLKLKEVIDHVWCLFDKDSFPKDKFDNAHNKIKTLNNSDEENSYGYFYNKDDNISYHSCATNEAFELWYCLYFDNLDSALNREQYIKHLNNIKQLKKIGFKYDKTMSHLHQILTENGGKIELAIRKAKDLCEKNKLANPSCYVYEFAEFIKPYLKNNS